MHFVIILNKKLTGFGERFHGSFSRHVLTSLIDDINCVEEQQLENVLL